MLLKVLSCVSQEHDIRLVFLAGLVCLLSTGAAFGLYAHARSRSASRWLWVAAAGVAAGSGVWATHFIGMLAFQPALKTGYEPMLTAASWAVAVFGVGLSLSLGVARPSLSGRLAAGAVLGLWVGVMHFTGMQSMRTQGVLHWDLPYAAAALGLGVALGAASLAVAGASERLWRQAAGALLATLAICALHFTAMAAVTIVPDPTVAVPPMLLSSTVLAAVLALLVAAIIAAAIGAVLVEAHTQRRALVELTEAAVRLEAARDEAETANRTRSEFLTAMSHELRTPLNGVRGMIQALGATPLTPDQRDMLRTLDASAHTLQRELASLFAAAGANAQWARIERPAAASAPSFGTARPRPARAPRAAAQTDIQATAPEPPPPAPARAESRPLRILIAEDHPVNRKVLSLILSTLEPELTFAEDGAEAVEALRGNTFDVVFMDMQMPRVDGLEATRALRLLEAETGAPRTPVVMLTAHALPEHADASKDAGADRHLTKPVSAADVLGVLQEFCGPSQRSAQAA